MVLCNSKSWCRLSLKVRSLIATRHNKPRAARSTNFYDLILHISPPHLIFPYIFFTNIPNFIIHRHLQLYPQHKFWPLSTTDISKIFLVSCPSLYPPQSRPPPPLHPSCRNFHDILLVVAFGELTSNKIFLGSCPSLYPPQSNPPHPLQQYPFGGCLWRPHQ